MSNIMSKLDKTKFLEAKAKGKNNTEAALRAGAVSKTAAHKAGYRLAKQLDVQSRIDRAIKQNGIDLRYLIKIYADAAKATKTTLIKETGEIVDSGIPDHGVRMKAADKLLGLSGIEHRLKTENPMSQNDRQQMTPELEAAMKSGDDFKLLQVFTKKD